MSFFKKSFWRWTILVSLAGKDAASSFLQLIVGNMPRNLTGIEVRFLTIVAYSTAAGREYNRSIEHSAHRYPKIPSVPASSTSATANRTIESDFRRFGEVIRDVRFLETSKFIHECNLHRSHNHLLVMRPEPTCENKSEYVTDDQGVLMIRSKDNLHASTNTILNKSYSKANLNWIIVII